MDTWIGLGIKNANGTIVGADEQRSSGLSNNFLNTLKAIPLNLSFSSALAQESCLNVINGVSPKVTIFTSKAPRNPNSKRRMMRTLRRDAHTFLVLDANGRAVTMTPFGTPRGSTELGAGFGQALNLTFDERANRLLFMDRTRALRQLGVTADGRVAANAAPVRDFNLGNAQSDAQGITLDTKTGTLWVLFGLTRRLRRLARD